MSERYPCYCLPGAARCDDPYNWCDRAEREAPNRKTPEEWAAVKRLYVLDPDGWRGEGSPSWDEPIDEAEFDDRAAMSTVGPLDRMTAARGRDGTDEGGRE